MKTIVQLLDAVLFVGPERIIFSAPFFDEVVNTVSGVYLGNVYGSDGKGTFRGIPYEIDSAQAQDWKMVVPMDP